MVKETFNKPKPKIDQFNAGRVLSGIAISVLNQNHKHVYISSCYAYVARAMREGRVLDTDEIVLVGHKGKSHHAFVVRDKKVIIDSFAASGSFDYESERYTASGGAIGNEGYALIAKMTFANFKQRYNSETLNHIPEGKEYPLPS